MTDAARKRATWVAAIICLQAVAATFFVIDALDDLRNDGWGTHLAIEFVIAAALLLGVVLNALQLRDMMAEAKRARMTIQAASGAMAELMALRFAEWKLTAAEADVALLAMKGFNADDIARLRETASGTVRAQLTRIYAKAGVSSRAGLVALFVDDLLGTPLQPNGSDAAP